jgi:hypothetical protein
MMVSVPKQLNWQLSAGLLIEIRCAALHPTVDAAP